MAPWSGVTAQTAKNTKLPADMKDWFEKSDYDDYTDVAMASSTEDGCEKVFVVPMTIAKVKTAVDAGIGVVKLKNSDWRAETSSMSHANRSKSSTQTRRHRFRMSRPSILQRSGSTSMTTSYPTLASSCRTSRGKCGVSSRQAASMSTFGWQTSYDQGQCWKRRRATNWRLFPASR